MTTAQGWMFRLSDLTASHQAGFVIFSGRPRDCHALAPAATGVALHSHLMPWAIGPRQGSRHRTRIGATMRRTGSPQSPRVP